MQTSLPDLVTVADLAKENPRTLSEPTLRDLIYHAEPRVTARGETVPANGFAPCIVRIGRRILIDRNAFAQRLEKGRAAPLSDLQKEVV